MTLPPHVLQKIEREARDKYGDQHQYDEYYADKTRATVWASRAMALLEALAEVITHCTQGSNFDVRMGIGICKGIAEEAIAAFEESIK